MKKYSFLLFDADGTLFDFSSAEKIALENTLTAFGLPVSNETTKLYEKINNDLWKAFEKQKITLKKLRVERFSQLLIELRSKISPEKCSNYYIQQLQVQTQLLPHAESICKKLFHQCKMAIITNGIAEVQNPRVKNSTIWSYMQDLFISEEIGYPKPDSHIFDYVFKKIECHKKEIMIIGDSLHSDILGGKNAGIATCWFNPEKKINETSIEPDYEIHDLREIMDFVNS